MSSPRWLATMIQLRRQHRDECRRQFHEAEQAAALLAEKGSALQEQAGQVTQIRRRAADAGGCDVNLLLEAQRHQVVLQVEHRILQEQIELVQREVERRQTLVVEAEQQLRVLEKLAEQRAQDARRQADRREAKRLDELATLMPQVKPL